MYLGELAVARFFGLPWEGMYYEGASWDERGNDVKGLEVRATFRYDGGLVIKPDDVQRFPRVPYVLVILQRVSGKNRGIGADLRGWCYGEEGPNLGRWLDEGFWVIRRQRLRRMEDLSVEG